MSARDELAGIIRDAYLTPKAGESAWDSQRAADRLLAAGYSKPRTITTAEELDALEFGSAVLDNDGDIYRSGISNGTAAWWQAGPQGMFRTVALPATVLYTPKES